MSFQIVALHHRQFAPLFDLSDAALADRLAVRSMATAKPGFPCRVSLSDAEIGDEVMLVNHPHQAERSPFRAAHAIYVRKGAEQARPAVDEVPAVLASRVLSLRVFDARAMMVEAALVTDGGQVGAALDGLLALPQAAYVHIHYATFGCYAARAERV